MRILIAPDKFKGSLTAIEAAQAIHAGLAPVFPDAQYDLLPIADGGEGTCEIFLTHLHGEKIPAPAHDALGREIVASYAWFEDLKLAVIEMSEASGLWRLRADEQAPLQANTWGTGELMADPIKRGARKLFVTLGGSATNDAGLGMAHALGWRFYDAAGNEIAPIPANFLSIQRFSAPPLSHSCEIVALADVTNPLLGPSGATQTYGPQKGISEDLQEQAETALTHIANVCHKTLGQDFSALPGAGAAGGMGFGLMAFCEAQIQPGFQTIASLLKIEEKVALADLVITAEGCLDAQTHHGKGPIEMARLARRNHKPVFAFAGRIENEPPAFAACIPIADGPLSLEESSARAAELLEKAAGRVARILEASQSLFSNNPLTP